LSIVCKFHGDLRRRNCIPSLEVPGRQVGVNERDHRALGSLISYADRVPIVIVLFSLLTNFNLIWRNRIFNRSQNRHPGWSHSAPINSLQCFHLIGMPFLPKAPQKIPPIISYFFSIDPKSGINPQKLSLTMPPHYTNFVH